MPFPPTFKRIIQPFSKDFSIKRNFTEVNRGRRYPAFYKEDNLTMLAISCMRPQEAIDPTKLINETQLTTCRNYCIPSKPLTRVLLCTAARYSALVFLSHLISVFPKDHLAADWSGNTQVKTEGAKVPFLALQEAQLWCGSLFPTMAMTSACALPLDLVTAAPRTGTGKGSVVGKWMTHINPGARERARGQSGILFLSYTSSLSVGFLSPSWRMAEIWSSQSTSETKGDFLHTCNGMTKAISIVPSFSPKATLKASSKTRQPWKCY